MRILFLILVGSTLIVLSQYLKPIPTKPVTTHAIHIPPVAQQISIPTNQPNLLQLELARTVSPVPVNTLSRPQNMAKPLPVHYTDKTLFWAPVDTGKFSLSVGLQATLSNSPTGLLLPTKVELGPAIQFNFKF